MGQITAAVIGMGYMGKRHMEIWHQLGARIVLCSREEKSCRELAELHGFPMYTDYISVLEQEKPDAVSICLPTAMHYETAKAALERGIAVLCEKPFTTDSAEAKELCRLAEERGVLLMVGHVVRFTRAYAYLKRCIEEKRFGALKMLEMHRHTTQPTWSADNWLADIAHSGGAVKDLHIHESDILCHYFGMPQSVFCVGDHTSCTTLYTYPEYPAVSASASWRSIPDYPFTAGYDAVFENAVVRFADCTVTLCEGESISYPLLQEDFPPYLRSDNALENEIMYFHQCLISGEKPVLCPPGESLDAMRINEAELRSLQTRRPVSPAE